MDAAGNGNTASATTANIHVDTIVPTATISGLPTGEEKDAFTLTITFNEDVSGFATEDLMVTGQATATAVAAVSGSESEYTATITPNANKEGDVTVQVKVNAVTDDAGNSNTVSAATSNIHIDTIAPTATISGLPTGDQKDEFPLTITFNEDVTGFAMADLTVTGEATATAVSGGPKVYTATITPNANKEGNVTVKVKADAVTDAAGNTSAQSDTYTIRVDTLPPEVESITGEPDTEQNGPFDLTVTFTEPVFDFEAGYANDVRWGTFTPELGTPEPNSSAVLFQFELRQGADGDSVYQVRITPMSGIEGKIRFRYHRCSLPVVPSQLMVYLMPLGISVMVW